MGTQTNGILLWLSQNWALAFLGSVLLAVFLFFVFVTLSLLYHWLRYERDVSATAIVFFVYLLVSLALLAKAFRAAQVLIS